MRGRVAGWRRRLSEAYDAGQAWIVVSLIGKQARNLGIVIVSWSGLVRIAEWELGLRMGLGE